jgi:hypothetical protein
VVDDEVLLVVFDVRQEAGEVEAAKMEEETAEGERRYRFEEVESYKASEVASSGLNHVNEWGTLRLLWNCTSPPVNINSPPKTSGPFFTSHSAAS